MQLLRNDRHRHGDYNAAMSDAHCAPDSSLVNIATPCDPTVPAWLRVILPITVAVVTFTAFLPALDNGFVNWDDDKILLDIYGYRGLGSLHIHWMFTHVVQGHYHPLTWLSYAIDYTLWGGLDPFGFHLTNVLLHAGNAVLLFVLATHLLRAALTPGGGGSSRGIYWGAALAALLFAVHPLRVESVAWVTERRDVLSTLFLLSSVICYVRYRTDPALATLWYGASVFLLVFSLFSKAWGMTLPLVLLVMDFYPFRRLRWGVRSLTSPDAVRAYIDKIPFVLPAVWAGGMAAWAQSATKIMKSVQEHSLTDRAAQALYGLVFYVWKTVLPTGLAPIHEIPVVMNPYALRFVVAATVVVIITTVVFGLRRRWPAGWASWVCYVIVVAPVLGIAQSGPQRRCSCFRR